MITEIEIDVPVRTAYDQWTQFEDFPLFMDYVEDVAQLDDRRLHWKVRIAGVTREWDAEITEQTPDQRIAWTSVDGTSHAGVVTFHALDDDRSRVVLQLDMHPHGILEHIGDKVGFVDNRAERDLVAFKEFIEQRGRPTGSFRGEFDRETRRTAVHGGDETGGDDARDRDLDLRDRSDLDDRSREELEGRARELDELDADRRGREGAERRAR